MQTYRHPINFFNFFTDNCHYEKIGSEVKNIEDEIPFELPDNWCWVRHNSLFEIFGGSQPPKSKFSSEPKDGYIRLYQIRDYGPNPVPVYIPIETAHKTTKKGDILLARYGASLGKVFWAEDGAYNVAMAKVEKLFVGSHICNEYLYVFYKSYLYQNLVLNNSRSAQAGFNKEDLESLFFPVPPFSEQERIVEALSKFEPLLESYTNLEKQASFFDSEIYDKLKKSILQYAIQGKLVEQDENDEPASVLLERIRTEKKAQLGKKYVESHIYKGDDNCYYEKVGKNESVLLEDLPFDIPDSWSWARLQYLIDFSKSITFSSSEIKDNDWVLDLEDIEKDSGKLLTKKRFSEVKSKSDKHKFRIGNVLYSKLRPYLNKVIIADEDGYCTTEILAFDFGEIDNFYAQIYLMSPFFVDYAMAGAYGVKMPRIGSERGNLAYIPIPPKAEQERICLKIKEIFNRIEKDEI